MPTISKQKKDKVAEQIIHYLFTVSPESKFTSEIAQEIARDEEFVKSLLQDLKQKKVVVDIDKNNQGRSYTKRRRWRLSSEAYTFYKKHQSNSQQYL